MPMVERGKGRILVLGMGISGMAAARLLAEHGYSIEMFDTAPSEKLSRAIDEAERLGAVLHLNREPDLSRIDEAVISPGFPPNAFPAPPLRQKGVPIISEIELACRFAHGPVVGVTGTNGKSTVTTLTEHFLLAAGIAARAAGNLGTPWADLVGRANSTDFISVLELSSFQLEEIVQFRPDAAAFLNLAPDHLDRYASVEEYGRAKWNMCRNQIETDLLVVPPELWEEAGVRSRATRMCVALADHGRPGAFVSQGAVVIRDLDGKETRLACPTLEKKFPFQITNGLFSLLLAQRMGADPARVLAGWEDFSELAHRIELVREVGGVLYFNDSKATNVHATASALANIPGPIIWLAGGSDKRESFAPLSECMGAVKVAILYGATRQAIAEAVRTHVDTRLVETLEQAVALAASLARPGDRVLLSPASASYDQFRNFAVRGNTFKKLVGDLP